MSYSYDGNRTIFSNVDLSATMESRYVTQSITQSSSWAFFGSLDTGNDLNTLWKLKRKKLPFKIYILFVHIRHCCIRIRFRNPGLNVCVFMKGFALLERTVRVRRPCWRSWWTGSAPPRGREQLTGIHTPAQHAFFCCTRMQCFGFGSEGSASICWILIRIPIQIWKFYRSNFMNLFLKRSIF